MPMMTKKARVDAALRGELVDRAPVSLWRHFYESEETAEGLADAMLRWQTAYDWDWLKINPRASYHVEGWGVTLKFSGNPLIKPTVLDTPIKSPADWAGLRPLPMDRGPLAEQLEAVQRIREGLGGEVYALETLFTPLSIAADLVGGEEEMLNHLRTDPQAVHGALEVITETFREFTQRVLAAGASGLFFATTAWASYEMLDDEQYAEFGRPYDLRVLEAAQGAPFNLLHACKNNSMVLRLADYPVHAINWAVGGRGNPSLADVQAETSACVVGGIRNDTLQTGTPDDVAAEARAAAAETNSRRFMLGPECSIAVDSPDANVRAARIALGA